MQERRVDIDGLRVLAILLVFTTHTAQIFSPLDDWHIASADTSRALGLFTVVMAPGLMPLFMMLAGMSAWLALRNRSAKQFAGERAFRVFLPLLVGTLVVVPPQVYLRRLSRGEFQGSFLEFYPQFFIGVFPDGNFSYGHLWFLAYLFTYMLAGIPFFALLRSSGGHRFLAAVARLATLPGGILWLFLPLAFGQILLRPLFPMTTGALWGDWSTHAWFFPVYLAGFAVMEEPSLEAAIQRDWRAAFFPALLTTLGLILFARPGDAFARIPVDPSLWHLVFWTGFTLSTWSWLIFLLGGARAWLTRSSRFLEYWKGRIYPFYIFHQTVIVLVAYLVVRWPMGVWVRFLLIFAISLCATLLLVEAAGRSGSAARLFGMRPGTRRRDGADPGSGSVAR